MAEVDQVEAAWIMKPSQPSPCNQILFISPKLSCKSTLYNVEMCGQLRLATSLSNALSPSLNQWFDKLYPEKNYLTKFILKKGTDPYMAYKTCTLSCLMFTCESSNSAI